MPRLHCRGRLAATHSSGGALLARRGALGSLVAIVRPRWHEAPTMETKWRFDFGFLLFALAAILILQGVWTTYRRTEVIPHTEFLDQPHWDKIGEVQLGDQSISAALKNPLPDRRKQMLTAPVDPRIADEVDPRIADELEAAEAIFRVIMPQMKKNIAADTIKESSVDNQVFSTTLKNLRGPKRARVGEQSCGARVRGARRPAQPDQTPWIPRLADGFAAPRVTPVILGRRVRCCPVISITYPFLCSFTRSSRGRCLRSSCDLSWNSAPCLYAHRPRVPCRHAGVVRFAAGQLRQYSRGAAPSRAHRRARSRRLLRHTLCGAG